jgi:hypothetical protein
MRAIREVLLGRLTVGRLVVRNGYHEPREVLTSDGKAQNQDHQRPGSRAAGLATAFKLIESAQGRWRAVNAPHLVALVRAGAVFVNGSLVERPEEQAPSDSSQSPAAAGQETAEAA